MSSISLSSPVSKSPSDLTDSTSALTGSAFGGSILTGSLTGSAFTTGFGCSTSAFGATLGDEVGVGDLGTGVGDGLLVTG